jgi:hypothetical protein
MPIYFAWFTTALLSVGSDANDQNLPQSGRLLYCVRSGFLDIYFQNDPFRPVLGRPYRKIAFLDKGMVRPIFSTRPFLRCGACWSELVVQFRGTKSLEVDISSAGDEYRAVLQYC